MENNSNAETFQICRTCMKELVNNSLCFNLDFTPANTELTIKQKLYDCIPELDLSIVPNAVICNECADIVNSIYKFKNGCLQMEMKIHIFIQHMQQTDSVVDLTQALQFLRQPYESLRTELKTEAFEVIKNFKANESTLCDSNNCDEAEKHTEREYLLSLQKIDLENVLFNTDDNYITYNTSESKENSDTLDKNIVQNSIPQVVEKKDNYIQNVDTADIMYQCYTCGHKSQSKLKLIVHIKTHTAKYRHHQTASKSLLRNNESIALEPTQRYSSIENSYNKPNSKNLNIHTSQVSDSRNDFRQDTSSKSNVGSRMLKELFKCSVCEYRCNKKSGLKSHMRIHTSEKPFKCSVCEYCCRHKYSLKNHMHLHTGGKLFKCSICEYQCNQRSNLKAHIMRIHTGVKSFHCQICKHQFITKSDLKRHILIHTGEKPFQCQNCDYRCSQKSSLKPHMLIHMGVKPFKCFICENRFREKMALKRHLRIHADEKPFQCHVCEYQCRRKGYLKDHIRKHTGEKPFKCSVCKCQYSFKYSLKCHMQKKHSKRN